MGQMTNLYARTPKTERDNSGSRIRKAELPQEAKSPADRILFLQRTIGNQAVQRLIKSGALQAKLTVNPPGDIYEQKANRVARQVVSHINQHTNQRQHVQRQEMSKKEEEEKLMKKELETSVHRQQMCPECEENLHRKVNAGSENIIQRKIIIGGKDFDPNKTFIYFEFMHDKGSWEIIDRMHNNGNSPDYQFKDEDQFKTEIKIRSNAIKGMEDVHEGCCNYPSVSEQDYIDNTYWKREGWMHFVAKLPSGAKASDAIEAIFKPGAKTRLECWTTMVSIEYYALLKGIGKEKFNLMYPGGVGLEISIRGTTSAGKLVGNNFIFNKYKSVNLSNKSELLPGDWVYFKNFKDYLKKNPGGSFQGENAIYMGENKFRGFGSPEQTEEKMNNWLVEAYQKNDLLKLYDQNDLKMEGGGLQLDSVNRPDIGKI